VAEASAGGAIPFVPRGWRARGAKVAAGSE
jgi:hypothetical protein